jgi:tetratricopeptide (TPR) repeat protein
MGDGVLAYFGYPRADEHDAERAVRAGLQLVEAVAALDTAAEARLQVRIGIGSGVVVVGDLIGQGEARERGIVGETPNLAARLQVAAAPATIAIDSTTRRLLGGLFEYRDLGSIDAKGFADRVQAYEVVRPSMVESRFEALRTATTPLVGRDEEIDLLLRRWEQAKRGDGCVVLISGEPGIGKSRLIQVLQERLRDEPHTRLRFFCSPHHQDSALYPAITQLQRAARFRREDAAEQRLDKLEAVLAQATNDLGEATPLIVDLLAIPTGDRYPPLTLTPQKRKEKTLHALLAQAEGLAARHPVLMTYEDVHWSDPTTRESLDLLIDRVARLRVLVVITFRPEFTPPWVGRSHVTLLSLSRLPRRQRAEMIARVTGGKVLPKNIAEQIIDRTDGVPLFIEELTKAVIESGVLTDAGDRYTVTGPLGPLAVPTTLNASLLARFDRLAPTREVAQIAAALGRSFSHELISAVAQMPQQQTDGALAQLVAAELVFRRGTPPDAEYTFKHALVQDAAYSTLLRSRRQQLHARIAGTLEDRFPMIIAGQPALLAHHCEQAGLGEKAIDYLLSAARQAWGRSMLAEAVALLRRGLALVPGLPDSDWRREREFDLQIALAQVLISTQGWTAREVGEASARARELSVMLKRPRAHLFALWTQWEYEVCRADHKRARKLADEITALGEASGDVPTQMLGCYASGYMCVQLGELMAGQAYLEKCRLLYDPADAPCYSQLMPHDVQLLLQIHLSWLLPLGHLDQALSHRNAALDGARRISEPQTLSFALMNAGQIGLLIRSEPRSLLPYADENLALCTEHELRLHRALGLIQRGWCLASLGEAEEGIQLLTTGLAETRDLEFMLGMPWWLTIFADACRMSGQVDAALENLVEAERLANESGERWILAESLRLRGDVLLAMGDPVAAEGSYREAIAIAEQQSAKLWELHATMSLARLWRDQGEPAAAYKLLAPVYGWFTEGFDTPVLQQAKALLDALA